MSDYIPPILRTLGYCSLWVLICWLVAWGLSQIHNQKWRKR